MNLFKRLLTTTGLSLTAAITASAPTGARADSAHQGVRAVEVVVQGGFKPNRIEVVQGDHVQITFVRKESGGCTREVVFPALGIRKELPPGEPVVIHLPELKPGEYAFTCGMNMIKGKLVVRARLS